MTNDLLHIWTKPASASVVAVLAEAATWLSVREIARRADVSTDTAARVVRRLAEEDQALVRKEANRKLVRLRARRDASEMLPLLARKPRADDPARIARRRLPVRRVGADDLTRLGWPIRMPDVLISSEDWARHADLPKPYVTFRHERPLQWSKLRLEDIIVAFLDINPLISRALFERAPVDRRRLRRRIVEEDKLTAAATVNLDTYLGLPSAQQVERIPEEQIQRQLRQNPARAA